METSIPPSLLLIVGGGIAAYKAPELIRRFREQGVRVTCILTKGGKQFITALSLAGVSNSAVYEKLFLPKDETEMGHIRLSREASAIILCPASADLLGKMANGLADDLASACLLASDKPIFAAPSMNVKMWENPAVQANIATLKQRGVRFIGPEQGDMACGEYGYGRLSEPENIAKILLNFLAVESTKGALAGKSALVTAGPTHEALDAVRFIGNYSSGKQGYAIAEALCAAGAAVTLVSGPCASYGSRALAVPAGVRVHYVLSAAQMLAKCLQALPCDIAVCAAAVADWRVESASSGKLKKTAAKQKGDAHPFDELEFVPTVDILQSLAQHRRMRPTLVVGFAAECDNLRDYAKAKLKTKACDIILANCVDASANPFGSDDNEILLLSEGEEKQFARMSKRALADLLVEEFIVRLQQREHC